MKKVISFLRSMKFGMILLVLVMACSVAGSLIVQQGTPMDYVKRYGADTAQLIMALKLNDVFSAPYFIVLMAALCLNLTLCSIVRLPRSMRAAAALRQQAEKAAVQQPLNEAEAREYLTQAKAAAERMKKNLTRYTTVL